MSWKSEFKEQLQLLEGNPLTKGDEALLLCYALENEIIPEETYFTWAQKQTFKPRIKPAFFSEHPAPLEVFQKNREKMPWSKALLPIGEWDGHLLVAGVLAPQSLPPGVIFLFASPSSLLKFYDAFFGESSPSIGELTMAQVKAQKPSPELSLKEFETSENQLANPELVLADGDEFEAEATPTEESLLSEEGSNDKLDLNFDSTQQVNLDFTQLGSTVSSVSPVAKTETPASVESSEPSFSSANLEPLEIKIEFPGDASLNENSDFIALDSSGPNENSPPDLSQAPEIKATPILTQENKPLSEDSSPDLLSRPATGKGPTAKPQVAPLEVKATPTLVQESPVPENSVVLQTPVGIKGKNQVGYFLSQWNTKTLSGTFKESFEKMKTHFDRCLILSLSDDEQKAKVLFWDSQFQEPMQDFPIELRKPSIFYIAAKTAKPFHGPISINEENEKFFELWNRGKIPSHTTIIPIIVKDQVVAMLMGVGESSAYNRATLHFAEKMGAKISETLTSAKVAA